MGKLVTLDGKNGIKPEAEAVIINWFVRPGRKVEKHQLLAEVMVEKVSIEIRAELTGILESIIAAEGTIVTPGMTLAIIEPVENLEKPNAEGSLPLEATKPRTLSILPALYVVSSPAARKLARELGLDLSEIAHSLAPGNRLNEAAVRRYLQILTRQNLDNEVPSRRQAQSSLRRLIRNRVSRAGQLTAPATITTRLSVNFTLAWLYNLNISGVNRKTSLLALVIRATALALHKFPIFNASLENSEVIYYLDHNISLMYSAEDGLALPVIKQAGLQSLTDLSDMAENLKTRACQGNLTLKDTLGGTFTICDLGDYAIDSFTPILNLPQSAVLGIGCIYSLSSTTFYPAGTYQILEEWEDNRHIGWGLTLSLTFDHRLSDGPNAAAFLKTIRDYLETPDTLR